VIGAGIAGLLAARVLSEFFSRVTVIERDKLPVDPRPRPGVPQSRHAHVLLVKGLAALEELFPGIRKRLIVDGAVAGDVCAETASFVRGDFVPRFASDLHGLSMSRDLLESRLRERVSRIAGIRIVERSIAAGLVADENASVAGVRVARRAGDGDEVAARLVVDASGSASLASKWLAQLGLPPPRETRIDAHIGYATRRFRQPEPWPHEFKIVLVPWWPPFNKRAGAILPEENGRIVLSLIGAGDDVPPTDTGGFAKFARQLENPLIAEIVEKSEPVGKIVGYRPAGNRLRDFSAALRRLDGFLVVGDALCTSNPAYGQGMTVAGLQATILRDSLAGLSGEFPQRGFCARVQRRLAGPTVVPWLLATSEDFRHLPQVDGRPTPINLLLRWYTDLALSNHGVPVTHAFYRTINMVEPFALFRPDIAARVLMTRQRRWPAKAGRGGP
jgi:flavin-dependent dehydrogenase